VTKWRREFAGGIATGCCIVGIAVSLEGLWNVAAALAFATALTLLVAWSMPHWSNP
jgi:hypothetical protein